MKSQKMRSAMILIIIVLLTLSFSACTQTNAEVMQDGYYTAEAAEFDAYGWKEFITVYINNNRIVTIEYNAKNASGFIKSWDMNYMRTMNAADGTYPNEYTRTYAAELLNGQDPADVDVVSGATHSYSSFQVLAEAVIAAAKSGDTDVVFIDLSTEE